jgi:hypothetical protein
MTLPELERKFIVCKARIEKLKTLLDFITDEYETARSDYDELEYQIYVTKNEEKY